MEQGVFYCTFCAQSLLTSMPDSQIFMQCSHQSRLELLLLWEARLLSGHP